MRIVLVAAAVVLGCCSSEAALRPNLIVIYTDDHGYADLSAQGIVDDIKTPHIDALANAGARMTSGYCSAPQCVPSRAGLLTGKYQNRFGVESNGMPLDGFEREATIAERLQAAGYATGMIGKWHLGPESKITTHGFDDVFSRGGSWTNFDLQGEDVPAGTVHRGTYHLDAGSAAARAFVDRHRDEPFFLYVAYRAPHVPLDATREYLDRFPGEMPERRRQALAMISAVDDGVGGIMARLREHGIEERTLVFFIGDNGAPLKIHRFDAPGGGPGWDGSLNDPLNGEKGMLTEGGIRVPFVASWKGTIVPGQVYQHPVITLDVAATALSVAGLPADPELDGVDLIPFLSGERSNPPHPILYWRWIAQSAAREGKWKYLRGGQRDYLFDLSEDPEEKHDLLAKHPEIARNLKDRLNHWSKSLQPPGLQTREMSTVWESYFDFYLDGEPAPPRPESKRAEQDRTTQSSVAIQGWITRNGHSATKDDCLEVRPDAKKGKARPFLAASRLEMPGPLTVSIELQTDATGRLGLAWREEGQADFPPEQVVWMGQEATPGKRSLRTKIPTDRTVIHVRLLLPPEGADIARIGFTGIDGRPLRGWDFRGR